MFWFLGAFVSVSLVLLIIGNLLRDWFMSWKWPFRRRDDFD